VKQTRETIPAQRKGAKSDISYSIRVADEAEAKKIYAKARKNLFNINGWSSLAGGLSAEFYLTDPFGKEVSRLPLQGDYIKIHLPASAKDKFDWVRIEKIEEEKSHSSHNWVTIRVRPAEQPKEKEDTEHFFTRDATSSFSVERKGTRVKAFVSGRNELPNTETHGFLKKLRNAAIALAAMAGLNTPQWKALVKGLILK
jgi:hypothetical protein